MTSFKKIMKFSGFLLFAILLSVCMVTGVAPVLPKRKEQVTIEIKMEAVEKKEDATEKVAEYRTGS
jgi:hypothetical protein